ncbi:uncharacterized protein Z520_02164 [Fonsecaea multimorphosa CBS 102226]|uniref:Uncharacterized protein n=1 Tax=Fonsecaea multimorphosa CBS 102226 TaxID=1442371 RepID=A0A0D2HJF6_9EURO|nr:uncharacterized protein Z520_02164 [Fonsecaea multimorphosa CBS 102226]KIY02026.1 hypothetical protein Z520_02164 [Fonsecaea multimorphosa CBS 102226]OAL29226.1 hypothetical protein AYO22_02120 [Fonsecaea multimorphosa]
MSYSSAGTSHERTEKHYNYGIEVEMGQSTSRPKQRPAAPRQEEEGWGLFHHGQDISAPEGSDSQQAHEENLAPSNATPETTEDAPAGDEIPQSSASEAEDTDHEDEDQMDPTTSHESPSAQDEQDNRSDNPDEEPGRYPETSTPGQGSDFPPDVSGEETGKAQISEPPKVTERETGSPGADCTQGDPRVPENPHEPVASHSADRTPYTWFDMVIDLDDPKPLGPAGYFPGPLTMPEPPPLGP